MIKTKRIENPIYVVKHIYMNPEVITRSGIVGVYENKEYALEMLRETIKEICIKIEEEVKDYCTVEADEYSDNSFMIRIKRLIDGDTDETHKFEVVTLEKNQLYVCNCVGLS